MSVVCWCQPKGVQTDDPKQRGPSGSGVPLAEEASLPTEGGDAVVRVAVKEVMAEDCLVMKDDRMQPWR